MAPDSIGLKHGTVVLSPHSPHWKLAFEAERQFLQELLGEHARDIHHIGSTAIPGLSAKPIIDILVVLHRFSDIEMLRELLEKAGYEYWKHGSNEIRILFVKGPPEKRTHHIHFTEYESDEWKKAFAFWEYLRSHPEALREYEELKQGLAEQHPLNRDQYSKGKASFIKSIIQKAKRNYTKN